MKRVKKQRNPKNKEEQPMDFKPNTKLYTTTPEDISEKRIEEYKDDNTNKS